MKYISIRQLHEATGKLVREAARHGYVVTDRGRPIAKLIPADEASARPSFGEVVRARGPIAQLKGKGPTLAEYIREERDRR